MRRNEPFFVTLSCDKALRGPGRGTLPGNQRMNERKPVRGAIAGEAARAEATQQSPLNSEASMHTDAQVKKTGGGRLSREDQRRLGDILQRVYDEVLRQGVPDRFKDLLDQFDKDMDAAEAMRGQGGGDDAPAHLRPAEHDGARRAPTSHPDRPLI